MMKAVTRRLFWAALIIVVSLANAGCEDFLSEPTTVGQAAAQVANGLGVPDAGAYFGGPLPHKVAYAGEAMFYSETPGETFELPAAWKPNSISELQLVACLASEYVESDKVCSYQSGNSYTLRRVEVTVTLREARTANIIASTTLTDNTCPPTTYVADGQTYVQSEVLWDDFEEWLRPFAEE